MRSFVPLLLLSLAIIGCVYSQPCVSSLTVPLRISVCDAPLGTVNLQLRPNGTVFSAVLFVCMSLSLTKQMSLFQ